MERMASVANWLALILLEESSKPVDG